MARLLEEPWRLARPQQPQLGRLRSRTRARPCSSPAASRPMLAYTCWAARAPRSWARPGAAAAAYPQASRLRSSKPYRQSQSPPAQRAGASSLRCWEAVRRPRHVAALRWPWAMPRGRPGVACMGGDLGGPSMGAWSCRLACRLQRGLVPQRQQPQQAGMVQPGSGLGYAASAPSRVALQASAAAHGESQGHMPAQPPAWQQEAPAATTPRPQAHVQLQAGYALGQQQSQLQAQTGSGAGSQQGFPAHQVHPSAVVQGSAPAQMSQPQNPRSWQQGPGGHNASAGSATPLAAQAKAPSLGSGSGESNAGAYGRKYFLGRGSGINAAEPGSYVIETGVSGVDGSYSQAAMAGGAGFGSAAGAHGVGGSSAAYYGGEAPDADAAAYGRSVAGLHPASSAGTALHGSGALAFGGGQMSYARQSGVAAGAHGDPQYGAQASASAGASRQAGAPMQSTAYYPQHAHGQYAGAQQHAAPVAAFAPYASHPYPAQHASGGSAPGLAQGAYRDPGPALGQGFSQQRGAGASGAAGGSQGAHYRGCSQRLPRLWPTLWAASSAGGRGCYGERWLRPLPGACERRRAVGPGASAAALELSMRVAAAEVV